MGKRLQVVATAKAEHYREENGGRVLADVLEVTMSDGSVWTCEYDGTDCCPLIPSFKELTEEFHNRPDEHSCECDCEDEPEGDCHA